MWDNDYLTEGVVLLDTLLEWKISQCPNATNEYYTIESTVGDKEITAYYHEGIIFVDFPTFYRGHKVFTCKSLKNGLNNIEKWLRDQCIVLNKVTTGYLKLC